MKQEGEAPFYVVWGDKSDYPASEGFKHIDLEDVFALRDSSVVIEDIISPLPKVLDMIRTLFHKIQRHHNLKLWFVTHTAMKNNTYSLLSLYHEIVLTKDAANQEAFQKLVSIHKLPAAEAESVWKDFSARGERLYLSVDPKAKSYKVTDYKGQPPRLAFEDLSKRIKAILASIFDGKRLERQGVLLDYIFSPPLGVDRQLINGDLSMSLEGTESGTMIKVSLVDYLATVTDEDSSLPSYKIMALHEYITSKIQIPALLIKNHHLQEE